MTIGIGGSFGIPRAVRKAMELLQWADWPVCESKAYYLRDAALYASLRDRIKRGKAHRDAMRRGP